ncbi:MAG: lycopene cyclase domain-containing protein [Flammeovirgaceae bacterium]|nr:lycopene cyclase domain-containing protein [Flammeovirgaceae bacterium]
MPYLYLLLDISCILFPLFFSFYKQAPFYKQWKYLWVSTLIPGVIFIAWDEWFTQSGIWGFNDYYLTGLYIASLPIEEILFFICIPYSCVFTYDALNYLIKKNWLQSNQKFISVFLIFFLTTLGLLNLDKWYSAATFISTSILLVFITFIWKPTFMGRFYISYLFILLPFFIVNGILTGSWIENEVVWYNNQETLGIRIGTIPVEDIFYGMLLILLNICLLERMRGRRNSDYAT